MKDFRDLVVWQKSHAFTMEVYRATSRFPDTERYGLTSQLRRSAASIPANIAEGCGRGSDPDLRRFLQMAMGSASESEYHILLAEDLEYIKSDKAERLASGVQEIKRMLATFIAKLAPTNPPKPRA
ncbi:hypothetical protein Pla175_34200 [Pirellulimonas nuda]|uniref:Four helix bundle protein n=1 Tax=Pirellulimonas nuda TaxID=2528009 RepID=A0A518DEW6_9BACT|nr:four helix bundle protein [Pirellulimonas nuda]QDU90021.1 hypothetical protein Pla175_34200 [Pirellulimonas nuda]